MRHLRFLVAPALALIISICAGGCSKAPSRSLEQLPEIPQAIGDFPLLVIPRQTEPIALSANLDDGTWRRARKIFLLPYNPSEIEKNLPTEVRTFCTDKDLYVAFRCGENDPATAEPKDVANGNSVELFIEPQASLVGRPYHHLVIDAAGKVTTDRGHTYPRYFKMRHLEQPWQPALEVKTQSVPGGWICAIRVPFADLHVGDEAINGGLWRLNFCRNRAPRSAAEQDAAWSWSLAAPDAFHSPDRFGFAIPEVFARRDLPSRIAQLNAATPKDPTAGIGDNPQLQARIDAALADCFARKPKAADELKALAYSGHAAFIYVRNKLAGYIADGKFLSDAAYLQYDIEFNCPDDDPPAQEVLDYIARFDPSAVTNEHGSIQYRLLSPSHFHPAKKYPLIIMLHGSGERGSDNFHQLTSFTRRFADDKIQSPHPCFMMAPQCPVDASWADTRTLGEFRTYRLAPNASPMTLLLLESIDKVLADNPSIDRNRIYISGYSLGGYGVYEVLMRRPRFFAAATVVSAAGDETQAALFAHIPIWIFHGALDHTFQVAGVRNMVAALEAAGGDPRYTEFPQKGHSIGNPTVNSETLDWLFAQKRTP